MRFIHTADWHLGQKFYDHDRVEEHQHFLNWLKEAIRENRVELLLIAGDVFDVANPSSEAQTMFYRFLAAVALENPHLEVIVAAGNHDSASRLEAPADLLRSLNIRVTGNVRKTALGEIDYDSLIQPVYAGEAQVKAYCLSVPYLRPGDYPAVDEENGYMAGIALFYQRLFDRVMEISQGKHPVIAMGHLHASNATLSDSERSIRGGLEVVSAESFNEQLAYTALGHIHKAQRVGGSEKIRYSGSPLPMSFSEVNYNHQVVLVDVETGCETTIQKLEIPRLIDLKRIGTPDKPLTKDEVFLALNHLPDRDKAQGYAPYIEVNVYLEEPEPLIQNEILEILRDKHVRFCRSQSFYPQAKDASTDEPITLDQVREVTPADMLEKVFMRRYGSDVPADLLDLFNDVVLKIYSDEDTCD
ncbi:MAG: exonuclease subunit SbcD [Bacteroidales bacterium]